jgi:hypothetical protein
MPVTAKLSQKFYERLGDDIANELVDWFNAVDTTNRNDLRDLNELNFQRFDAKVDQRFAEADTRMERRLAEVERRVLRWMFGFWIATLVPLAGLIVGMVTIVR